MPSRSGSFGGRAIVTSRSPSRRKNTRGGRKSRLREMPQTVKDWPWLGAAVIVIGYAFLMRLTPVGADDLFFLLNTARWIVEHGEIPWVDTFSYTAPGAPWIYPIGSGLLFYAVWLIGSYGALSAMTA